MAKKQPKRTPKRKSPSPASQGRSQGNNGPQNTNPRIPDNKPRNKLPGREKHMLKEQLDLAKRERLGSFTNEFQKQFSKSTRKGSQTDVILEQLMKSHGDRKVVFQKLRPRVIFGNKTDNQLKWQIAQTAWRFGFRKRD